MHEIEDRISLVLVNWAALRKVRPVHDSLKWYSERLQLSELAESLANHRLFDNDVPTIEQDLINFEQRMQRYREDVLMEILRYGSC